jgi:hypothetical protein
MYTVYSHYSFDITCYKLFHRFYFLPPPPLYVQNIFWPPLHWSKIFYGPSKFPPAPYPALIMTGPLYSPVGEYNSLIRQIWPIRL